MWPNSIDHWPELRFIHLPFLTGGKGFFSFFCVYSWFFCVIWYFFCFLILLLFFMVLRFFFIFYYYFIFWRNSFSCSSRGLSVGLVFMAWLHYLVSLLQMLRLASPPPLSADSPGSSVLLKLQARVNCPYWCGSWNSHHSNTATVAFVTVERVSCHPVPLSYLALNGGADGAQ